MLSLEPRLKQAQQTRLVAEGQNGDPQQAKVAKLHAQFGRLSFPGMLQMLVV